MDVAELSERLVPFDRAKYEDPKVTVDEIVAMPGRAGFAYGCAVHHGGAPTAGSCASHHRTADDPSLAYARSTL